MAQPRDEGQVGREAADQSAARRLREKAAKAEREAQRSLELEERLPRLSVEAAAWQAKALAEQVAAVALHAQLQQAAAVARPSVEELVAAAADAGLPESSSAHVDLRRAGPSPDRACLGCRLRLASVVLFPCRHLSLCGPVRLCVQTGRRRHGVPGVPVRADGERPPPRRPLHLLQQQDVGLEELALIRRLDAIRAAVC